MIKKRKKKFPLNINSILTLLHKKVLQITTIITRQNIHHRQTHYILYDVKHVLFDTTIHIHIYMYMYISTFIFRFYFLFLPPFFYSSLFFFFFQLFTRTMCRHGGKIRRHSSATLTLHLLYISAQTR